MRPLRLALAVLRSRAECRSTITMHGLPGTHPSLQTETDRRHHEPTPGVLSAEGLAPQDLHQVLANRVSTMSKWSQRSDSNPTATTSTSATAASKWQRRNTGRRSEQTTGWTLERSGNAWEGNLRRFVRVCDLQHGFLDDRHSICRGSWHAGWHMSCVTIAMIHISSTLVHCEPCSACVLF